jgi:hypothetical protein
VIIRSFHPPDIVSGDGAPLIVRESQSAQFVYLGQFGDTFGPGRHTLVTDNIPVLTRLRAWKYGFESPFKADDRGDRIGRGSRTADRHIYRVHAAFDAYLSR